MITSPQDGRKWHQVAAFGMFQEGLNEPYKLPRRTVINSLGIPVDVRIGWPVGAEANEMIFRKLR